MTQRAFEPGDLMRLVESQFAPTSLCTLLGISEGDVPAHLWEGALLGPARTFLARPGKQFRARLVEICFSLGGGVGAPPGALPLLVELLHAGSLIVDDIEDGSSHRRGGRALHQEYGVPVALNTGNWLYFLPFSILREAGLTPEVEQGCARAMSDAILGCHFGQALDLSTRVTSLRQDEVPGVVLSATRLKTGCLMGLAAELGAITAGASSGARAALLAFGRDLGMALQMLDDVGSLTGQRYEDLMLGRPTWPWAWLAEEAPPALFASLLAQCEEVIERRRDPAQLATSLRDLLSVQGEQRAASCLLNAFAALEAQFEASAALSLLQRELKRVLESYV